VDTHGSDVKNPKQLVDTGRSGNQNGDNNKEGMEKANAKEMETEETR
jgi:hypothetical protein